jgi:redox-sensing transcriptional repressor
VLDQRGHNLPEATVARLAAYLTALTTLSERHTDTCSSQDLAAAVGVNSARLRKDLSYLGSYGTRGVGYDVAHLSSRISRALGLTQDLPIVIAGVGHLGRALANHAGFGSKGLRVVALLDADPDRHGEVIAGLPVMPLDALDVSMRAHDIAIGVIATPALIAQHVADRMVSAGITSLLSFAPTALCVPRGVTVRTVDLASELHILAYHEQRNAARAQVLSASPLGADQPQSPRSRTTAQPEQTVRNPSTRRSMSASEATRGGARRTV